MGFLGGLTLVCMFAVLGFGIYWVREYRRKTLALELITDRLADCNNEMKQTLVAGLIHRFGQAVDREDQPLAFERFAAKVLRLHYGGKTSVTKANNTVGIGIRHQRGPNTYLGQAQCLCPDQLVDYMPVAIVHSQIQKSGASGGFVITTSAFTPQAQKYAQDTKIALIDGPSLVELWANALNRSRNQEKQVLNKQA